MTSIQVRVALADSSSRARSPSSRVSSSDHASWAVCFRGADRLVEECYNLSRLGTVEGLLAALVVGANELNAGHVLVGPHETGQTAHAHMRWKCVTIEYLASPPPLLLLIPSGLSDSWNSLWAACAPGRSSRWSCMATSARTHLYAFSRRFWRTHICARRRMTPMHSRTLMHGWGRVSGGARHEGREGGGMGRSCQRRGA